MRFHFDKEISALYTTDRIRGMKPLIKAVTKSRHESQERDLNDLIVNKQSGSVSLSAQEI